MSYHHRAHDDFDVQVDPWRPVRGSDRGSSRSWTSSEPYWRRSSWQPDGEVSWDQEEHADKAWHHGSWWHEGQNGQEGDEENAEDELYHPGHQVTHHDIVLSAGTPPRFVLLFMHSCSHGPEDVLRYVPYLWQAGLQPSDVRIVAPCSPARGDWQHDMRWPANSWFEYTTSRCWKGVADRIEFGQFVEQRERLLAILEEEHRRLPPGGGIVIGGLSQGASLALDVMLHAPASITNIKGCMCLRGMMQEETKWSLPKAQVKQRSRSCPVFLFNGQLDVIVPSRLASSSYHWLHENGFQVETVIDEHGTHGSDSLQELRGVGHFVSKSLTEGRAF